MVGKMITLKDLKEANEKLEKIRNKQEISDKAINELKNATYSRKWEREKEVQNKFSEELGMIEAKNKQMVDHFNAISESSHNVVSEYEKIIENMDIINRGKTLQKPAVYSRRWRDGHKYYEPTDTIQENKYAFVYAYIVENDKPKNKFSLVIIGNSIFDLPQLRKGYMSSCNTDEYASIEISVKDFPTSEEALKYYQKNSGNTKKEIYETLNECAKFYEEVKKLYEQKEWKIKYLDNKKQYYSELINRNCPEYTDKYNELCKELNDLISA
jgi:hypothetical protein